MKGICCTVLGCICLFLERASGFLVSTPKYRVPTVVHSLTEPNVGAGNDEILQDLMIDLESKEDGKNPNTAMLVDGDISLLTTEQIKVLQTDGVVQIDSVLSSNVTDALKDHFLEQKILAWFATIQAHVMDPIERYFYGGETSETRCALQLSLLRGGFAADNNRTCDSERHILADSLLELFREDGTLRSISEELITTEGVLLGMSALITEPGNDRENLSSDEFEGHYTISIALEDVTYNMAPTNFLLGSHTEDGIIKNVDQPSKAELRVSTLKKGDAVVYDNRVLRSQSGNDAEKGSTSAVLNISLGTPAAKRNSSSVKSANYLRPGYQNILTLGDLEGALNAYDNGDDNVFNKYGDGLEKQFENTQSEPEET